MIKISKIDKIIRSLDKLAMDNPEQEIIIETPDGSASCRLSDANIYEGCDGSIVIDAE